MRADESNCTAERTESDCDVTLTPSGVEMRIMPNLHIKSRPMRLMGHSSDNKNECLKENSSGVTRSGGGNFLLYHLT